MKSFLSALGKTRARRLGLILAVSLLAVLSFILSLSIGTLKLPLPEIIKILAGLHSNADESARMIILNIRLPRSLSALLVGAALSVSGALLQSVMKNPLASPSIIGVNAGAGAAGVALIILLPGHIYLLPPLSFAGALAATLLIYFISWQRGIRPYRLILSGVAVSSLLAAFINGLMILYPESVANVIGFMVGGLAASDNTQMLILLPYIAVGVLLSILLSHRLNLLSLGDERAAGLGMNVELNRMIFIAIASLLAAAAVSAAGLLGFVGLITPHISRIIIGRNNRYLVPFSAVSGSLLLLICDTVARTLFSPLEIPVGIIMAFFGAPFFLYLLRKGGRHAH